MSVQVAFWHHFLPEGSLAGLAPAPSFHAHPHRHTVSPLPAELGVPSWLLSSWGRVGVDGSASPVPWAGHLVSEAPEFWG